MASGTVRARWLEFLIGLGLLVTLAAILLPALARSREGSRRSSCPNNLKQLGLVMKMYANESPGNVFPPLSPILNNWIMDMNAVYPEYLTDLNVLACPSSPFARPGAFTLRNNLEHPGVRVGEFHPDCVASLCYTYTGYAVTSDEQALAFFDAYYDLPPESFLADLTLDVPILNGASERTGDLHESQIPAMWDRVPLDDTEFAHVPKGCNVLYKDGHVEFHKYSYYNASSEFPVTRISAETFGSVVPYLSSDCYGLGTTLAER